MDLDVIVIGAGVAGLAALRDLDRAGLNGICLEARDRIGGRILTVHDPLCPIPIELGAEFIHGKPLETWDIVRSAPLAAYDCTENALHIDGGVVHHEDDAWLPVSTIMEEMQKAADKGPDRSFAEFIEATNHTQSAKDLATAFVEGFNAADSRIIGIASLAQDSAASENIDGDCSFRILDGYDAVPNFLAQGLKIETNAIVESVAWKRRRVTVCTRSAITGVVREWGASAVIVTVPLGVLQHNTIRFIPEPVSNLEAAAKLQFGPVVRTVLRFHSRVWEERPELANAGFLLSREPFFPTWWTPLPFRAPVLTGWSAGPKGAGLAGQSPSEITTEAIARLARITGLAQDHLARSVVASYFHDWQADPFSYGAYSYTPAGAQNARAILAEPSEETLFFAGEATETEGHSATVHGAIATGRQTARRLLASVR